METTRDNTSDLLRASIARVENAKKQIPQADQNQKDALKRIVRLESVQTVLVSQMRVWLDEFEEIFNQRKTCDSPAIAQHYMDCARFMELNFGRTNNSIKEVKEWYDNYKIPVAPQHPTEYRGWEIKIIFKYDSGKLDCQICRKDAEHGHMIHNKTFKEVMEEIDEREEEFNESNQSVL